MDEDDYPRVTAACGHALAAYPTCLSAHRLMGEACLEQGEVERASEHFERTLALDPLNVVARLGLGVACEERSDPHGAYTNYLRAWDLNPALDQIRDELVRLRTALGTSGRLHLTRAGLATTFARGGQYERAVAEWRAVLAAEPQGDRALIALAEMLWRQGDDLAAATACREVLAAWPDNARALAILADIESRHGEPAAAATAERYRAIDPIGDVVALIAGVRVENDLNFLLRSAPLDEFIFDDGAVAEPPIPESMAGAPPTVAPFAGGRAPAPDLWDSVVLDMGASPFDDGAAAPADEAVPFKWSDGGPLVEPSPPSAGSLDRSAAFAADAPAPATPDDELIAFFAEAATPVPFEPALPPPVTAAADDARFDLERALAGVEPFAVEPDAAASGADMSSAALPDRAVLDIDSMAAFTPDAALEPDPAPAAAVVPEPVAPPAPAPPAPFVDPYVTADGRVDLTVGWDQLDRVLDEATPKAGAGAGYDDLLAEFDAGGIAPFLAAEPTLDGDAWEPFTADELMNEGAPSAAPAVVPVSLDAEIAGLSTDTEVRAPAAPAPAVAETTPFAPEPAMADEVPLAADDWVIDAPRFVAGASTTPALVPAPAEALAAMMDGWDQIDEELTSAIPEQEPSGYAEMLRNIDSEGILPFDVEDGDDEIDALATPDAVGDPLDFDDLLTVTSRDGTSSLSLARRAGVSPVADAGLPSPDLGFDIHAFDAEVASAVAPREVVMSPGAGMPELEGLVPFSFDGMPTDIDFDAPIDYSGVDSVAVASASVPDDGSAATDDPWGLNAAPVPLAPEAPTATAAAVAVDVVVPEQIVVPAPVVVPVVASTPRERSPRANGGSDELAQWPTHVGGTSELIDRHQSGLFERLREEKAAMVGAGRLVIIGSLARQSRSHADPLPTPAATTVVNGTSPPASDVLAARPMPEAPPMPTLEVMVAMPSAMVGAATNGAAVATVAPPAVDAENGLDLAGMRERLKREAGAATEIAAELEAAVARGVASPLLMRVLGEAYLKLGRGEQAAAQFRQAMSLRGRRR